jgi:hypothetical protein
VVGPLGFEPRPHGEMQKSKINHRHVCLFSAAFFPFFVLPKACLSGDETNDTRSTKLPLLRAVLARRDLERKKSNNSKRERQFIKQTSCDFRKARRSQVSSMRRHQNLEMLQIFYCQRRRLPTLSMPRLRISIHQTIGNALTFFFLFCYTSQEAF